MDAARDRVDKPEYARQRYRTRAATQRLYRNRVGRGVWPTDVEVSDELLATLVEQGFMTAAEAGDPDERARALGYVLEDMVGL